MIGKIPDKRKDGKSSFHDLVSYCLTDLAGSAKTPSKAAHIGFQKILSPETAAIEMEALAHKNTRSGDPVFHAILSWREHEIPSNAQVDEAVAVLLGELNLQDCQALWVLQRDTENQHVHIVVNRIHPETHRAVDPAGGWTYKATELAARKIELKQGWEPEQNGFYIVTEDGRIVEKSNSGKRSISQKAKDSEAHTAAKSAESIAQALLTFAVCTLLNLQATAQFIAHAYDYHPALGWCLTIKGYPIYPFFRAPYWLYVLMSTYEESRSSVAAMSAFAFSAGLLLSVFAARKCFMSGKSESLQSLHGSAHWATMREIKDAGLLDNDGDSFEEGIVVGGVKVGKEVKMLRHGGKEHVLCYAPTRSGKGISLVLPTLLDGWKQSVFVLDIKQENFALSAGYRAEELGHKILKLDFTDPDALALGTSATFNPLEEVPLDFEFEEGKKRSDLTDPKASVFKLVPTGTYTETATIQQIVSIIVDPQGKGLEDHWSKTASSFMLGAITHLLYRHKIEGKGCPGIADVLTELSKPGLEWQKVVQRWQEYPHLGYEKGMDQDGEETIVPLVHPIVAQEAQSILNKPDEEAGSVLSTVISNMGLFRDPIVAKNTSRSSFRIRDLMNHENAVSCYLVINPNDQLRLMPLTRLVLTQIIFTLAAKMEFSEGRSADAYKHRLLLLLDEFPSLGKMDLFERALGFIGGYGLKSYIMVQGLPQLFKAYGKEESIRVGCHIQVAFAPNDFETCEYLSKSTGQTTVLKENLSESTQEGKLFGSKSRQTSLQEVQRPLMTPDECRRLPGLKKNEKGDVIDAGNMLIFPAGFSAIYGSQVLYFLDKEMDRRSKIAPPERSDNLIEVAF